LLFTGDERDTPVFLSYDGGHFCCLLAENLSYQSLFSYSRIGGRFPGYWFRGNPASHDCGDSQDGYGRRRQAFSRRNAAYRLAVRVKHNNLPNSDVMVLEMDS
jgi:hypothetical protein